MVLNSFFRDNALSAARRGWFVFPLHPLSKRPSIKQWEQLATTDESRIKQWWPEDSTKNIAIACGPSRIHVLDLDNAKGQAPPQQWAQATHGRDVFTQLAAAARQPPPVPTHTVATPSGGLHLYYRAPRELLLRNTIARLGWRIDSRGHGGYVVAAGSQLAHGHYRRIDDRPAIPLPDWLTHMLVAPEPAATSHRLDSIEHPDAYVKAALDNQAARIRNAHTGIRHRTVLSAANSLGRLVGAGLLDYDHAHAVLYDATQIHLGLDDFTDTEARRTITDGLTYAANRTAST